MLTQKETKAIMLGDTPVKKVMFRDKQIWPEIVPVTTAGIYHNETEGLISLSSDGENWITIADKNLGATQVWNDGNALTNANCGNYYQWGNNYGFWGEANSSYPNISRTRANITGYGPGNYYNSSNFIITTSDTYSRDAWQSIDINGNLWGGITNTMEARRGPCAEGFHVPKREELDGIIGTLIGWFDISTADKSRGVMKTYLKFPGMGVLRRTDARFIQGECQMWTSDRFSADASFCTVNCAYTIASVNNENGMPIRPFKNEPVQPDSTRTVLYQPAPTLLSWNEIVTMTQTQGTTATTNELNTYPVEYFNKFNGEGRLTGPNSGGNYTAEIPNGGSSSWTLAYIPSSTSWMFD